MNNMRFTASIALLISSTLPLSAQRSQQSTSTQSPQTTQSTQQLTQRLDSTTATSIIRILDSTSARGLPIQPLIARALEGASRHVQGPRIISVVRAYSHALADSRTALGDKSKTDEIVAGADVLLTGVKAKSLTDMRTARGTQSLTVPLVVLADLTARGVPTTDAADAVLSVIRTNAADSEFLELQRSVANDITRGARPMSALALRVQGITTRGTVKSSSPERRPKVPSTPPTPPIVRQSHVPSPQSPVTPPTLEFGTSFGIHARTWSQRLSNRQSWNSYPIQPSVSAGTWVRYGKMLGALSLEQGVDVVNRNIFGGRNPGNDTLGAGTDTLPTSDRKSLHTARPITDLTAALQWSFGRLEVQAFAGARFGNAQAARARTGGNLAYKLNNDIALITRFEHLPNREIAISRGTNMALGVRFLRMPRLWRKTAPTEERSISEFVVTSFTTDTMVIRVRATRANSVDVIGDVTNWNPTPLTSAGNGWWEVRLSVMSGVHHLNVRTDNAPWGPPPGIPTIQNAYDGLVGVIIIP